MMVTVYEECLDKYCLNPLNKLAKTLKISTKQKLIILRFQWTITTYKSDWKYNCCEHHIKEPSKHSQDSTTWQKMAKKREAKEHCLQPLYNEYNSYRYVSREKLLTILSLAWLPFSAGRYRLQYKRPA